MAPGLIMLLWLSTSTAPPLRFIKSQQPFGHQPLAPPPQSGLCGGIYLAAAAQGERPSITKSPCRVDVPKDILARASFCTCHLPQWALSLFYPFVSMDSSSKTTRRDWAIIRAERRTTWELCKTVEPKCIGWPRSCRLRCCLQTLPAAMLSGRMWTEFVETEPGTKMEKSGTMDLVKVEQ